MTTYPTERYFPRPDGERQPLKHQSHWRDGEVVFWPVTRSAPGQGVTRSWQTPPAVTQTPIMGHLVPRRDDEPLSAPKPRSAPSYERLLEQAALIQAHAGRMWRYHNDG